MVNPGGQRNKNEGGVGAIGNLLLLNERVCDTCLDSLTAVCVPGCVATNSLRRPRTNLLVMMMMMTSLLPGDIYREAIFFSLNGKMATSSKSSKRSMDGTDHGTIDRRSCRKRMRALVCGRHRGVWSISPASSLPVTFQGRCRVSIQGTLSQSEA